MAAARGVTLKLATSLDGRIATASGESRWITGEDSRRVVHQLRTAHEAVLAGIETVLADDPEFTVRLPGYDGAQPARVVLDSRQRLPVDSKLVKGADRIRTLVVSVQAPRAELTAQGVTVLQVPAGPDGRPSPQATLEVLAEAGLQQVLIEGGGHIAASFLSRDLVDRIEWFRAPILLGAEGRPCMGALGLQRLSQAPTFRRVETAPCGADLWERYERV
jgi:diaminohydroxyphosphoribosylaminopyrimidine deaminase/5-amino-6-(5-phosphoribosylamino)uracil reductase